MFTCKDFGTTDISEMTSSAVSPARYTYTALSFLKLALEYIPMERLYHREFVSICRFCNFELAL